MRGNPTLSPAHVPQDVSVGPAARSVTRATAAKTHWCTDYVGIPRLLLRSGLSSGLATMTLPS
jgi:hypothetical protein